MAILYKCIYAVCCCKLMYLCARGSKIPTLWKQICPSQTIKCIHLFQDCIKRQLPVLYEFMQGFPAHIENLFLLLIILQTKLSSYVKKGLCLMHHLVTRFVGDKAQNYSIGQRGWQQLQLTLEHSHIVYIAFLQSVLEFNFKSVFFKWYLKWLSTWFIRSQSRLFLTLK